MATRPHSLIDAQSAEPIALSRHHKPVVFGPGLVSGASACDPTTVASLAVVGATTVYGLAWLVILLLPMLAIVQAIAAHVGAVLQGSLQQAIGRTYGRVAALLTAGAVVVIGVLTLAADVKAGAEGLTLLFGVSFYAFVVPIVVVAGWLLASNSYLRIERILASFTLIFLCYVASAIYARPDWSEVLHSLLVPRLSFSLVWITGAIALLGTTLTSYEYYWESIEVAERRPVLAQVSAFKLDAVLGMLVAGSSFFFILVATAATSGKHHVAIQTAADAAAALKPLAGSWDQVLFGLGFLASAAIAIPVIAATNGYVLAQAFGARAGLGTPLSQAKTFYTVIFGSLVAAAAFALTPIPTIALLYWVSVAAGIATPITLVYTLLVAQNRSAMGGRPIGLALACGGWAVTAVVASASVAFIVQMIHG
ncbi:MAG: divalent metal cation transporter [Candidatus Eremiobacteraeota bacterium]|nr:divalent metal cation transporter [Candidatus Eremiobacteraeota bacterium]